MTEIPPIAPLNLPVNAMCRSDGCLRMDEGSSTLEQVALHLAVWQLFCSQQSQHPWEFRKLSRIVVILVKNSGNESATPFTTCQCFFSDRCSSRCYIFGKPTANLYSWTSLTQPAQINITLMTQFINLITNRNDMHKEIKHRLNSGNACYYALKGLLSSQLLSKNIKLKVCKTVILPVILYGCETWTLTLREEKRLQVFQNKVLRKILDRREMIRQANGEDYITGNYMIFMGSRI